MVTIGAELASGRFLVRSLLGEGAMGRVYRAFDARLEQEVALKTLMRVGADERYDLKREFRALAGFSHRNVVQLYELFAEGKEWFFTMQLVEGEPLLEYVRKGLAPGSAPSATRLAAGLDALAQVGEGLAALHAAGQVHRDVKPANIRVTPEGRALLLDFGLATLGRRGFEGTRRVLAGTPAYTAPEQIFGAALPASDLYALGAALFEILTGSPAFAGDLDVLVARKSESPPQPTHRVPGLSQDLDALVTSLLAPDPGKRPTGEAVVATLFALAGREAPRRLPARSGTPFVGRTEAQCWLSDSLARSRTRARVAWVRGPSGIGKSELVLHFATECRDAGAFVLTGRCRAQESVPFRSLDPLVDDLSRHWLELDGAASRALVPEHAGALLRVFPVLARVPALAEAPPAAPASDDELLRRATAALRDVLAAIAADRPLVVWIDDAQWGDRGSVTLLRSLLRGPDAPRLLLLISHRAESEGGSDALAPLRDAFSEESVPGDTLDLPPLSDSEADALLRVSSAAPLDAEHRAAVVAGAGGSPFLLLELARHLEATDEGLGTRPQVLELLSRRLAPIGGSARRLLELAAVGSRPFPASFLLTLAGVGPAGHPIVLDLCAQSLLRTGGGEVEERLEPYHDRIREAVLASLAPDARRMRHREIAEALSTAGDAEAGVLVEHWMGAGEDDIAAEHAVRAGAEAEDALAFDRAAEYFGLALRLRRSQGCDWGLQQRRAEALANAGRGGDSGEAYDAAVAALRAVLPDAARESSLRARAAEQYLYAGRVADGLARTHEVMKHIGVSMPGDAASAGRRANLQRARFLLLRRPGERLRSDGADAAARDRLSMLFGCAKGTALLFPKLSDYLGMIYLRQALAAGDAQHVAIGLAKEASLEGALPGPRWRARAARLLATARSVAEASGLPHVLGTVLTCESATSYFGAEWAACVASAERAIDIFRNRCVGEAESLSITITFLVPGLVQCGELRRVRELLPGFLDDAQRRGDLTLLRAIQAGDSSLVGLAEGDPAGVIATADRLRMLSTSSEEASLPYHYALATWRANLYQGDVPEAWRRLEDAWEPLRASGMLTFEVFAVRLGALRAATALLAATRGGVSGRSPGALARLARAQARRIERSKLPFAAPWAAVLRAGLAALRRDGSERASHLRVAREGFAAAGMPLHAHACALLDADALPAARREAEAFLSDQGVKEPERMAAALVPGVAAIHS